MNYNTINAMCTVHILHTAQQCSVWWVSFFIFIRMKVKTCYKITRLCSDGLLNRTIRYDIPIIHSTIFHTFIVLISSIPHYYTYYIQEPRVIVEEKKHEPSFLSFLCIKCKCNNYRQPTSRIATPSFNYFHFDICINDILSRFCNITNGEYVTYSVLMFATHKTSQRARIKRFYTFYYSIDNYNLIVRYL